MMKAPTPWVAIYTDGSLHEKDAAWAAIMIHESHIRQVSGYIPVPTKGFDSTRVEMIAVLRALLLLPLPSNVHLFTDSQSIVQVMRHHIKGWVEQGIRRRKHSDLWLAIESQTRRHNICWNHVEGHSGHHWNTRVDQLTRTARQHKVGINSTSSRPRNYAERLKSHREMIGNQ